MGRKRNFELWKPLPQTQGLLGKGGLQGQRRLGQCPQEAGAGAEAASCPHRLARALALLILSRQPSKSQADQDART